MTKRIPLRNRRGGVVARALVDDADFEWLSAWPWQLAGRYVTRARRRSEGGPGGVIALHREIMGLPRRRESGDDREVDHRNRDRLDNRRSNLRIATGAQNKQNVPARRGLRGTTFDKARGKWIAKASLDGRSYNLGGFDTEEEAAAEAARFRAERMPFAEVGS